MEMFNSVIQSRGCPKILRFSSGSVESGWLGSAHETVHRSRPVRESVRATHECLGSRNKLVLSPTLGQYRHVVAAGLAVAVPIEQATVSVQETRGANPQLLRRLQRELA